MNRSNIGNQGINNGTIYNAERMNVTVNPASTHQLTPFPTELVAQQAYLQQLNRERGMCYADYYRNLGRI